MAVQCTWEYASATDALSHLSLSSQYTQQELDSTIAGPSHRGRQSVLMTPRPPSRALEISSTPPFPMQRPTAAHTNMSTSLSPATILGTDSANTLLEALELIKIPDLASLREHQLSAIVLALKDEPELKHIFLSLATGSAKSLCCQVPAIVQSRSHQKVTIVIQPTLEITSGQVKTLKSLGIDVEIISSLVSSERKNDLASRLYQVGYHPALIYTTADSFFGHYNHVFTTLKNHHAMARIVLDEDHTVPH